MQGIIVLFGYAHACPVWKELMIRTSSKITMNLFLLLQCVAVLLKMGANTFEFKTDDGGNMLHFAVKYASHFKDSQECVNDTSLSLREVLKALNLLIDDVDNYGEQH